MISSPVVSSSTIAPPGPSPSVPFMTFMAQPMEPWKGIPDANASAIGMTAIIKPAITAVARGISLVGCTTLWIAIGTNARHRKNAMIVG